MAVNKDHTTEVLFPGKKIAGKYSLQARLGRSNIADVWLAEKDKKVWVVKLYLLPHSLTEEQWHEMQSILESLPQFPSPLLQRPVESGMIEDLPYVILPYCHYGSAHQWAGKLSESELATFMYQGAKALKMLHEAKPAIMHRNLHLFNFLIDQDLNYVLADVELSGALRGICEKEESGFIHTAYQAPETFQDEPYGPAADIFSFGVCMFQMATGQVPFGVQGGQRLLHWVQTPKLPEYFSDRFNQIVQVCIGRVPSGRPSADILVRLAERYLAEEEWKSIPGFSFGVGRSAKKKNTLIDRLKPKKQGKVKKPAKSKAVPTNKQEANPYAGGKKSSILSNKWLIPVSIAFGIGITLYLINPLLNINSGSGGKEVKENSQGPIFAPTPSPEPIARAKVVENGNELAGAKETENADPVKDTVPKEIALVDEAKTVNEPLASKEEPLNPPPPKLEAPVVVEKEKSQIAQNTEPAVVVEPKAPANQPKAFKVRSQDMRSLRSLISSANKLEAQLSSLAFASDSLSGGDQAYLQQVNSELNLLGKQIEGRVVFDASQNIIGWKKEANNPAWLKQMNASVRQHQGNLKRIQESLK